MDKPEENRIMDERFTALAKEHANNDVVLEAISAIHAAGWAAGKRRGYDEGFNDGRKALSGFRAVFTPFLVFAGAALGVWLFGITLRYFHSVGMPL